MNCTEVKYYLKDYAGGHLIDEMRLIIKDHIDFCFDCGSCFNEIMMIENQANSLPEETSSKEFWEGISDKRTREKRPAKIYTIHSDEYPDNQSVERELIHGKSARKNNGVLIISLAAAAVLLGAALGVFYFFHSSTAYWTVEKLSGKPIVGSEEISGSGMLKVGEWLETDKSSRARIKVGVVGEVDVLPESRLKLVETKPTGYRISLEKGKINAAIWASPKLFIVETPFATAIDLGCSYTLEVAEDGSGILNVTTGWVALRSNEVKALIPAGAICKTKKRYGFGIPYFADAGEAFKASLDEFNFGKDKSISLPVILKEARKKDALSLWYILSIVKDEEKEMTFNKLSELVKIPAGITYKGIMNGNEEMMNILWESLGYGRKSLWNYF